MDRVRLDQHTLEIKLTEQLPQRCLLVVLTGGVAGLTDRHAQGCQVQRYLGNERRAASCRGLNRASQGLAVTHQLIEIRCATWHLGDRPVTDRGTESGHIHLLVEVAES